MTIRELDYNREIINLLNGIRYEWRTNPVILGGSSGSEGGSTGAPGGTIGQVGQRNVAGDTTEGSLLISSGSISSLLDNLKRIRYWELPARQFQIEEHSPTTGTYSVSSGSWHFESGSDPLIFTGGETPSISAVPSNSRIDLLTINTAGVLSWTPGTASASPVPPSMPDVTSGSMPLWLVKSRSGGTKCRNYDDGINSYIYRDVRPFLSWGLGGSGGTFTGSGDIPFVNTDLSLTEDSKLFWDNDNKQLIRGLSNLGAMSSSINSPGIINVNSGNDGSAVVSLSSGSGVPAFAGIKINGTPASPAAVITNDILVRLSGRGWGSTVFGNASRGRAQFVATQNWTDGAQGTEFQIWVTPNGSTTPANCATFENSGVTRTTGRKQAVSVKNGDYTLTESDEVVVFETSSTATLPPATGSGRTYRIVCASTSLTIQGNGSDVISGGSPYYLLAGEDLSITDYKAGNWA